VNCGENVRSKQRGYSGEGEGGREGQRVDKGGGGEELKQEIEGSCHNQASRYFCSGKFCAR